MQMDGARQCGHKYSAFCYEVRVLDRERSPPPRASALAGGVTFIEHSVSQLDTLAGVAIKYGVEVADIKKMNGLATDIQMYALKSIHIPLPGRHPPSPCFSVSDASETPGLSSSSSSQKTSFDWSSEFLDSCQSSRQKTTPRKVSAAMSSLQGYYGIESEEQKTTSKCCYDLGNGSFLGPSPASNPPLSRYRKSRSINNVFLDDNGEVLESSIFREAIESGTINKLVRGRQKSEADFTAHSRGAPELLLREDNTTSGAFSAITGKCLALRSNIKAATGLSQTSSSQADDAVADEISASEVRKSPSTSSLQDQESSSLASIWAASKWPDLQVLSTAAITRPIFDGIHKPVTIWRNKTAVD